MGALVVLKDCVQQVKYLDYTMFFTDLFLLMGLYTSFWKKYTTMRGSDIHIGKRSAFSSHHAAEAHRGQK
jgi:hypothetical protein